MHCWPMPWRCGRGLPLAEFADATSAQAAIARLEEPSLAALEEQAKAPASLP